MYEPTREQEQVAEEAADFYPSVAVQRFDGSENVVVYGIFEDESSVVIGLILPDGARVEPARVFDYGHRVIVTGPESGYELPEHASADLATAQETADRLNAEYV